MELDRIRPAEPISGLRVSRLRRRLCALGVSELQVVYSAFEGYPFASLTVLGCGTQPIRIDLPRSVRKALRRLFRRQMALTYPAWPNEQDSAGIVRWDLENNARCHQHFGYRPHFFERKEIVTSRSTDRIGKQISS
jgi:hypothetical protein